MVWRDALVSRIKDGFDPHLKHRLPTYSPHTTGTNMQVVDTDLERVGSTPSRGRERYYSVASASGSACVSFFRVTAWHYTEVFAYVKDDTPTFR